MSIKIEMPPSLSGRSEDQVKQLYGYLYRLSENLNVALNAMEQHPETAQKAVARGTTPTAAKQNKTDSEADYGGTYNELRALIMNTATSVNNELHGMDVTLREEIKAAQQDLRSEASVLEASLKSELTAVSEQFGSFQENIESTISLTAREILQRYGYDAAIEALQSEAAGFEAYRLKTEGYIRQGFIDYDENGVPIIGIAIGQGLTSTTVTIDGEEYEQFDPTQSCAFYTAERVSFRIHGQEVAYVSNRKLYIGDVEITGNAVLGQWQLRTDNGFAIKWIGGDG